MRTFWVRNGRWAGFFFWFPRFLSDGEERYKNSFGRYMLEIPFAKSGPFSVVYLQDNR
jgi:hypothetical protein